jgi:hypothetical protein
MIRGSLADFSHMLSTERGSTRTHATQRRYADRAFPKGVSLTPGGRYMATIRWNTCKTKYLGTFDTPEEAHAAFLVAQDERDGV